MKKALIVIAVIAIVAWVVTAILTRVVGHFYAKDAVAASAARPWPGGLGTLGAVAARYPPQQANAASARLKAPPKNDAVDEFVYREIARGELTIGAPPALPDVTAIRELLLHEPLVWARRGGVGDIGSEEKTTLRAMQMTIARALVASALAKARAHDAAAWDDLRAVWMLARSLDPQPEMMMQTAALAMARMINAVAWKMPLPAPPWLAELQQRDAVPPLLAAFQYQAASYWTDNSRIFPLPSLAASVDRDRRIAEAVARETRCDVTASMNDLGTDLSSVWRRALRYRAEREATANALRVREARPIATKSMCSDGAWTFDGATLRFSRAIATEPPDRPMPLVLTVRAANGTVPAVAASHEAPDSAAPRSSRAVVHAGGAVVPAVVPSGSLHHQPGQHDRRRLRHRYVSRRHD